MKVVLTLVQLLLVALQQNQGIFVHAKQRHIPRGSSEDIQLFDLPAQNERVSDAKGNIQASPGQENNVAVRHGRLMNQEFREPNAAPTSSPTNPLQDNKDKNKDKNNKDKITGL